MLVTNGALILTTNTALLRIVLTIFIDKCEEFWLISQEKVAWVEVERLTIFFLVDCTQASMVYRIIFATFFEFFFERCNGSEL